MKKLLLVLVIAVSAFTVNAQVQFGVKAGVNFANQKYTYGGVSVSPKSLLGFHAGVIANFGVGDKFIIQPGLLFSQKGAKIDENGVTYTDTYNYLDIPINGVYKIDAGSVKILLNAGPSLSYALSGKSKDDSGSTNIEFGSNEGQAKRLDFGIGFGGGVQFGSVVASLNYNIGLANIYNPPTGYDMSVKNNVFSISVAYLFGGK